MHEESDPRYRDATISDLRYPVWGVVWYGGGVWWVCVAARESVSGPVECSPSGSQSTALPPFWAKWVVVFTLELDMAVKGTSSDSNGFVMKGFYKVLIFKHLSFQPSLREMLICHVPIGSE